MSMSVIVTSIIGTIIGIDIIITIYIIIIIIIIIIITLIIIIIIIITIIPIIIIYQLDRAGTTPLLSSRLTTGLWFLYIGAPPPTNYRDQADTRLAPWSGPYDVVGHPSPLLKLIADYFDRADDDARPALSSRLLMRLFTHGVASNTVCIS